MIGMKRFFLACFIISSFVLPNASAQTSPDAGYMVIIGAFAMKENATRLVGQARKMSMPAKVELNPDKNLHYVVVLKTLDHDMAIASVTKVRENFADAWVFKKGIIEPQPVVVVEEKPKEEVKVAEPEPVVVVAPPPVDPAKQREEQIKAEVDKKAMTMERGKVETLDNIFFYKDASVLRPESRFAVDKLVLILKQNPNEKIRIHGHTNGNEPGKIIRRNDTSTDFFSMDNTIEDYGSAKELSEQRATVIRDYLVANGINKSRMSIKAWGGKKPLYDVDDAKAVANVRVEIEVLADK